MKLVTNRGITWVEYIAPPKPDDPTDEMILIPEKEGIPVVVVQYENGMTDYLYRVTWDLDAAARYIATITQWQFSQEAADEDFLGLPMAARPDLHFWIPRQTLMQLQHIRTETIVSPKAQPQAGGKRIAVPMGNGIVEIPVHGQGKRFTPHSKR
jgi:hypothetical protein